MTTSRPRTLADALKRIAALKREVEATRKRLVKDRDGVLAVADSEHRAMRALLDDAVAQRDEARARLSTAQAAYANLRLVCETEHAAYMDAEAERDEALDALDAVRNVVAQPERWETQA